MNIIVNVKIGATKRMNAKLNVVQHLAGGLADRVCSISQGAAQADRLRQLIAAAQDALAQANECVELVD